MTDTRDETRPTCGRGLAANAALPAKLGQLLAAQAEVFERHIGAIDRIDPNAEAEVAAYTSLAGGFRDLGEGLERLADQMASYRDLPMPRHEVAVLTAAGGQMDAFRQFITYENEVVALLQANLEAQKQLLV
jgi:hypothetical protein